jgi:hypothetical protein
MLIGCIPNSASTNVSSRAGVSVGAGVAAVEAQLAHVLEAVYLERCGADADRLARYLHKDVARLEAAATNLHYSRKPFRIPRGVSDELPDALDRSLDESLAAVLGHRLRSSHIVQAGPALRRGVTRGAKNHRLATSPVK